MDLKHIIPQQRRRTYGPSFDIAFSTDKSNVSRVGPNPVFSRASSGTFVNENRRIVGKTTSTTSLNPASVPVGGVAVFAVPSGSVVGWLNNSVVVVMEDTDGNDQIGTERHVTGTLIHKTDTAITLLVTSKAGTTTLSSWFVSYRGLRNDHDPVTGLCRGALIEESRTNLILQSENHPSASWSKTGVTVAAVTHTAPDGNTSSNLVSEDSSTGLHRIFQGNAYVSGTSYAISVFLKFAGRQFVAITHPAVATNGIAIFDIQNGSVTLQQSAVTASMVQYPNGWWRCVVVTTSTITGTQSHIIQGSTTGNFIAGSYTGLNGPAFYIFGSQVEAGSFATSYIPTTAAATIRSADVYGITGTPFSQFYNQNEGTFVTKFDRSNNNASGKFTWMVLAAYNPASPSTYSVLLSTNSSDGRTTYRNAGTDVYSNTPSLLPANTSIKSSYGYKSGDFATSRNGTLTGTGTGTIPAVSTFDRIDFGFSNNGSFGTASGQYLNGHIASISYYPTKLSNSRKEALTAIISEPIVYNGVAIWYNGEGIIETN